MQLGGRERRWRLTAGAGLVSLALLFAGGTPPAAEGSTSKDSAARELAEKYVPRMMVREQDDPLCGTEGEQYQVMSVDALFDNPDVNLRRNLGKGSKLLVNSPSLEQVAAAGDDDYLDLRGDPLGNTCVYAKDFDQLRRSGRAPVVVYAHIAREDGKEGLALQYWFYWYFNQFNDLHESDWEGMQIVFDADTPEQALEQDPTELILFQHSGGERARWTDSKVEKDGDHPVVYPAAGSHATFYTSAVFPQNGSHGSGVGCDNTTAPLRELEPSAELLPNQPTGEGHFAWLTFDGRWGQKEKGFNNGPTGPQTKTQWDQPFTWMGKQRWSSPRMPGGGIMGPEAVRAFCGVIENVTGLMNMQQTEPVVSYLVVGGLIVLFVLLFFVSRWRPADASRLWARREYGQIVGTSFKLYLRHLPTYLVLGAIAIPIVGGTQALGGWLGDVADGDGLLQSLGDLVNSFGRPAASAIAAAFVIVFLRELMTGEATGVKAAARGTRERFWRVVLARILVTVLLALMTITVIGIPFAIWKLVGWNFVQQEVIYTDKSIRKSLRGSSELVRGRWWHALRTIVPLSLVGLVLGPFLGLFLIFTALPLFLVNVVGSLVYALTIPFTTTGNTLLYLDLQVRAETEPLPRRSWAPWRPSTFGRRPEPAL